MLVNSNFPQGFLWGTATAAHQVEGNNIHSDFWNWEETHKNIPNSAQACNQYFLYKDDFKLIKEFLYNNAHRISIEWARIEPEMGKFDVKEIDHYREVLQELKNLGIRPLVTLHHFTNPRWFSDLGGWEKKRNVIYFERFCELCSKEYSDLVNDWVVINEPNIYSTMAYLKGFWPPHKKSILKTTKVYLNLARAHKAAYEVIHRNDLQAKVGSAINMTYFKGNNFVMKAIAKILSNIVNNSFLFLTRGYNDYIGINSYFFNHISFGEIPLIKRIRRKDFVDFVYGKRSDLGWTIYPQGIYHVCVDTWRKFKLPIMITENGVADKTDALRPRYIVDNLTWLLQAINDGVNIIGYFHWTLLDNIEWGLGKKARFGLFETNYETQKRTPRQSAYVYANICKSNSIQAD